MKKIQVVLLISVIALASSFTYTDTNSSAHKDSFKKKQNSEENKLPEEYFGSWLREGSEMPCDEMFTFSISKDDDGIMLSNGTEFGGYDIKVTKKNDYYKLDFEKRSEGEAWQSTIHLKLINDNLHIAWDGKDGEWMKYTKCPN